MNCYSREYKRRINGERILLMLPLNVVMSGRIKGFVDRDRLASVIDLLRKRHALLGVCVEFDSEKNAWFKAADVPPNPVAVVTRATPETWMQTSLEELKKPFDLFAGPLIRFTLVQSSEVSELVVCGHHAVCDGLSLSWLIRDILEHMADSSKEPEVLPGPPPIDEKTVPSPLKLNPVMKFLLNLYNKKWAKKNVEFSQSDLIALFQKYWERNQDLRVFTWELSPEETDTLLKRSRLGKVTVNTALWTALLAAQYDAQGDKESFRKHAGLAVSTRKKLSVPVGEQLGFYASSLSLDLKYNRKKSFWGAAKDIHASIKTELAKTDLFRMLISDYIHPTLLDSLYFSKYGLKTDSQSEKFLKKMQWNRTSYGYAVTNVGKLAIPDTYGSLKLEAIHGPIVYSDVNEKTVGVTTASGTLTVTIVCSGSVVNTDTVEMLKNTAVNHLGNALK